MAIAFHQVTLPPLDQFSAAAPDGAVIGLIGEANSGISALLQAAAGSLKLHAGEISGRENRRYIGPASGLNLAPVDVLLLDHAFAAHDAIVRGRAAVQIERLRRDGATVLIASHEEDLLRRLCDEVWWLRDGRLAAKGDPGEVIDQYGCHVARTLKEWGEKVSAPLDPAMRRGDGRAKVVQLETLGEGDRASMVWQSGAPAAIRVTVQFQAPVEDPVVGIMIRTRIGFEVYGTNTELEKLRLGPCAPGDVRTVTFRFSCDLCPNEYTVTAASHDPDGVWHDWLEDALAFTVVDSRYTAGVANLRAKATLT